MTRILCCACILLIIVNIHCYPVCVYNTGGGGGGVLDCTLYRPIRHDGADTWSLFWQNCPTISPRLANQLYLNPWQHTISPLTRDVDSDMPPHTMAYHPPPPPLLPRPEMSPLHPLHHPPPPPPAFQHHQHFPPHFPALGPTNSFSTPSGGEII